MQENLKKETDSELLISNHKLFLMIFGNNLSNLNKIVSYNSRYQIS